MAYLQAILLLMMAACATLVVAEQDPRRQAFLSGVYGVVLTLMFFAIQSADVALSELVTTTVAVPTLVLMALRKVKLQQAERDAQEAGR